MDLFSSSEIRWCRIAWGYGLMNKNEFTFEVADVPIARDRLPNTPSRQAIFHLLSREDQALDGLLAEARTIAKQQMQ